MSFFIVPSVSYQTQQKLKQKAHAKSKSKVKSKRSLFRQDEVTSDLSSIKSSPTSSTNQSVLDQSINESNSDAVNPEKVSSSLSELKKTTSMSSLASNKVPKGSVSAESSSGNSTSRSRAVDDNEDFLFHLPTDTILDKHRKSSTFSSHSTSTASTFSKNRRNSSLSSSQSYSTLPHVHPGYKNSPRLSHSLSTSFTADETSKNRPLHQSDISKNVTGKEKDIFRSSYPEEIPLARADIFRFRGVIDLSILNSSESIKEYLFTPSFQILRYNKFLQILSDHHTGDPINFANIRLHSWLKFINRHKKSMDWKNNQGNEESDDIRYYESVLAYELIRSRNFIRKLIKLQTKRNDFASKITNDEELVHINFTNYIRFILSLPDELPAPIEELDEILSTHYKYKEILNSIGNAIFLLKKEESGGEVTNSDNNDFLMQSITKVSYEYILLEMYHIQIFTKFNNNSIVESRTLKRLFDIYRENIKLNKTESVKVLNFNTYYSAQYSWYMSITIPFVRVFESNIYSEDENLISNPEIYYQHERNHYKVSFRDSDEELFENYFNRLNIDDYSQYRAYIPANLVQLHKSIYNSSHKYKDIDRSKVPDPCSAYCHKPKNFEYFTGSLSTIKSETFHLIQSHDLQYQISPENYRVILNEFYRILQKGGVLEIPLILLGSESAEKFAETQNGDFPSRWEYVDVNLSKIFETIPNFTEEVLLELNKIFGEGNVKYSVILLNLKNEVNNFLVNHIGLRMLELYGHLDEFCAKFSDSNDPLRTNIDEDVHYFIHISAQKT